MMNSQKGRVKQSNVEHMVNILLVGILIFELLVVTSATIAMAVWVNSNRNAWYLPYVGEQTGIDTARGWVTFLILFNNYVPISLYISLEISKSIQGQQINWDLAMYHPATDTPAMTRTTNLNEELGQIQVCARSPTPPRVAEAALIPLHSRAPPTPSSCRPLGKPSQG